MRYLFFYTTENFNETCFHYIYSSEWVSVYVIVLGGEGWTVPMRVDTAVSSITAHI